MKKMNTLKTILIGGVLVIGLGIFTYVNFLNKCTVIFDAQGGTSIAAAEVKKNSVVLEPNDPVMVGYNFDGWYLNDELFDFNTKITEDITLVAKWTKIETEND